MLLSVSSGVATAVGWVIGAFALLIVLVLAAIIHGAETGASDDGGPT